MRRSLFIGDTERSRFLNHLVKGTREVLRTQQGLAEHANYHEFCRLLGRLKTNYQLAELVRPAPLCAVQSPTQWACEIRPCGCGRRVQGGRACFPADTPYRPGRRSSWVAWRAGECGEVP